MIAQISLLFDAVLTLLLVATIVYAGRLHKRLNLLRSSRDELLATVEAFLQATERAEIAVRQLKEATRTNGNELQTVIQRARDMREDLSSMVMQGDHLANRLESGAETASRSLRDRQSPNAPSQDSSLEVGPDRGKARDERQMMPSEGELTSGSTATDKAARAQLARELAQDLGALSAAVESSQALTSEADARQFAKTAQPEKPAQKTANRKARKDKASAPAAHKETPRSRAEQELLSALGRRS